MNTTILYHAHCPDGFAAAYAAWLKFGDAATYIPVSYGEPVPYLGEQSQGLELYILDFSYPREVLLDLAAKHRRVVVLDHHKTAQEALAGLPTPEEGGNLGVRFDMEKSGCVLAWEYFHPDKPLPPVMQYVQDRDLWKWELPDSRAINAGLWRGTPRTFSYWSQEMRWMTPEKGVETVMENPMAYQFRVQGEAILRSDSEMIAAAVARSYLMPMRHGDEVMRIPCCNSAVLQSEIGEALLAAHPDAPFVAVWHETPDGRSVSLRSTPERNFDVSAVAKEYGGGGHPCAAGYRIPHLP